MYEFVAFEKQWLVLLPADRRPENNKESNLWAGLTKQ